MHSDAFIKEVFCCLTEWCDDVKEESGAAGIDGEAYQKVED